MVDHSSIARLLFTAPLFTLYHMQEETNPPLSKFITTSLIWYLPDQTQLPQARELSPVGYPYSMESQEMDITPAQKQSDMWIIIAAPIDVGANSTTTTDDKPWQHSLLSLLSPAWDWKRRCRPAGEVRVKTLRCMFESGSMYISVSTSLLNEVCIPYVFALYLLRGGHSIICVSYRPSILWSSRRGKYSLTLLPAYGRYTSK